MVPTRALVVCLVAGGLQAANGSADDGPCNALDVGCKQYLAGVYVESAQQAIKLKTSYPPGAKLRGGLPDKWYEYSAVYKCPANTPENPRTEVCGLALTFCDRLNPNGPGPFAWIYRRVVDEDGPVGGALWEVYGTTCFPHMVPGNSQPALTMQMIVDQFHRTPFALPQTSVTPPGNLTLVNLTTYYQLVWPTEGFEPGEIDTTSLVGHQVRIRPTLQELTYDFGDGSSQGPTKSLGGPWPDGDITHEYTSAATVNPAITAIYGGEVSIDGGEWLTIPASVTRVGPAEALDVRTSRNRLYVD